MNDIFEPVLERLKADAAMHFGDPLTRLEPLEYQERPFSHVLRVAVLPSLDDTPRGRVYIKMAKPKTLEGGLHMGTRVANDFATTSRIFEFLSPRSDLGAVRPIACYPDLLALVTEEAPGNTLLRHLETQARWFPSREAVATLASTLETVGRWLRAFHGFEDRHGQVSLHDLRGYVDLRLERLVAHAQVITETDRRRVLDHLDRLGKDIEPADLREVAIHADLAPGNILVSGRRVVVLDFSMVNRGSYLHDVSRLFLQLDVLRAKPQFRPRVIRALQSALLRGLDPALTADRPLFRFLSMLHRVNHLSTLALRKAAFPVSLFNSRVRGLHRRWIEAELDRGPGGVDHP